MGSMPLHSGPVSAVVLLLLLAGVQKLLDPSPTAGALRSAGFPSHRNLVRLLAAAEVAVAASFFVVGGAWPAIGAAVLYLGFAGFVALALTRNLPVSSCGCLGKVDTPPSVVHVAVNLGAVVVLVIAAIIPIEPMGGLVGQSAGVVVPQVLLIGAVTYLLYGLLTALPLVGRRALRATPLPEPGRRA